MEAKFLLPILATVLLAGSAQAQYTGSNQTNTISGVAIDGMGNPYYVGQYYAYDALTIQNGGVLSNTPGGYIGWASAASNNSVLVTDSGSVWTNTGDLVVGDFGAVGNSLTITNGGVVFNGDGYIGDQTGANSNTVLVTGSGSVWNNAGDVYVGQYGSGNSLTIASNGTVYNGYGWIGAFVSFASNNTVLVTGSGSVWSNALDLYVGGLGALNSLTITNGGTVYNDNGWIGYQNGACSNNTVLVTSSGSVWNNATNVYVGYYGAGNSLTIANGGAVYDPYGYIGYQDGANSNTGLVSDPGSIWNNEGSLTVGTYGSGNSLTITNGAVVADGGSGRVGDNPSASNNTVLVTGSGSVWSNAHYLYVGYFGAGNSLSIVTSGTVYNAYDGYIGYGDNSSNNMVLVSGSGSVWSSNSGLYIGISGPGNQLTITNGGSVIADFVEIGVNPEGNGTLTIAGGTITSLTYFSLGVSGGTGTLYMTGGQLNVLTNNLAIGERPGSAAQMVMSGGIVQTYQLHIAGNEGTNATGSLTISGGMFTSGDLLIGMTANSTGTVVVTGGSLADSGSMVIGASGSSGSSLTISNSGYVLCSGGGAIGASDGSSNNTVVVAGGGSLAVTNADGNATLVVSQAGGADSLTLNGGTVTVNGLVLTNGPNSVFVFSAGTLASGGTFVTNNQVFVVGDGTDAATFQLNGGIHSFANNLEITSNAVLTGCGTIEGNVTIDPGGTVLANCGGTLTFTGIVTNNGTMQAVNGTVLQAYGQVVNNGLINAINGSTDFLGGLVNNGCVLTERDVQSQISNITRSGTNITVQIESAACPTSTYQLQVTPSLKPASWTNLGNPQSGNGGVLTFSDSGGATNRPGRFYRIDITLP